MAGSGGLPEKKSVDYGGPAGLSRELPKTASGELQCWQMTGPSGLPWQQRADSLGRSQWRRAGATMPPGRGGEANGGERACRGGGPGGVCGRWSGQLAARSSGASPIRSKTWRCGARRPQPATGKEETPEISFFWCASGWRGPRPWKRRRAAGPRDPVPSTAQEVREGLDDFPSVEGHTPIQG